MEREEECVPKMWKEGDSVLLEKGADNEDLDNYRGITLQTGWIEIYCGIG